ncbi:MAG: hypothetical protein JWN70_2588 [Planctomycetaceae bacterium]|nr:hypothetical protein [Planctomycetaceae bacterium]
MATVTKRHTVDEYFEVEFASEERHEYIDGEIIQLVGGSYSHNHIQMNLYRRLLRDFDEPNFRVCGESTRIKVGDPVSYLFPDAALAAGRGELEDRRRDTLLDPLAVFEILSPSTERYNRGRKAELYRSINSLQYYVMISQEEIAVECFSRRPDGQWLQKRFIGLDASVPFESLNWSLSLAELYRYVELSTE